MKKKTTKALELRQPLTPQLVEARRRSAHIVKAIREALLPPELVAAKQMALDIAEAIKDVGGRCMNDQVLVLRSDPEQVSKGGIIIPDLAQEKSEEGVVVAVGPGHLTDSGARVPLDLKPGDAVKFSKYYGTEVKIGGNIFLQLHESECEFAI